MQGGDDSLLRFVIGIFEERGFSVRGAHDLLADLTSNSGHLAGPKPNNGDLRDAQRAADIVSALSPVDVGQGAVVAAGLCLGIETVQGTDAMLKQVEETTDKFHQKGKGVLLKAAKRGQDLRIDMPAIGPDTVASVARAKLAGIVIEAGKVMIINRKSTLQDLENAGLFLISQEL